MRVPVMAVPGSLATAETVAARVAVAGATVAGVTPGDEVAVAVFVGRNASEIAVALCGTAVGSDVFVAAIAGLVLVAVDGGTALPWSAANSSSVGTATQPARKSNRQNERRIAIRARIGTSPSSSTGNPVGPDFWRHARTHHGSERRMRAGASGS